MSTQATTKNLKLKTLTSICFALGVLGASSVNAGSDATVPVSEIENPWVDFDGDYVDWTDYNSKTVEIGNTDYPIYSVRGGEGVNNIGDWISGSFYENKTNRERYIDRFVDEFSLTDFNDELGYDFAEDDVRATQILLYNSASFTLDRVTVWVKKSNGDEKRIFSSKVDIVEEEVRDFFAILPDNVEKIRVGFKAKGEIKANYKKCDWVSLGDITGAAFKADGALYNKKCNSNYEGSSDY